MTYLDSLWGISRHAKSIDELLDNASTHLQSMSVWIDFAQTDQDATKLNEVFPNHAGK